MSWSMIRRGQVVNRTRVQVEADRLLNGVKLVLVPGAPTTRPPNRGLLVHNRAMKRWLLAGALVCLLTLGAWLAVVAVIMSRAEFR